jgi:hypothetical protein
MRTCRKAVRVGGVGDSSSQRLILEFEPGEPVSGCGAIAPWRLADAERRS